eukprot:15355741-Ditylum_brightwellii.AAC.1
MSGRDSSRELLPSIQENGKHGPSMVAKVQGSAKMTSLTDLFSSVEEGGILSVLVAAEKRHRNTQKIGRREIPLTAWQIARNRVMVNNATALLCGANSPKPLRFSSNVVMRKEWWGNHIKQPWYIFVGDNNVCIINVGNNLTYQLLQRLLLGSL